MKRTFFIIIPLIIASAGYSQTSKEYNVRGTTKLQIKDYTGAIADFTKAIELNPSDARAYSDRGIAKTFIQDNTGAIADLTKAIEINPKDTMVYFVRGSIKRDLKDFNGAIADFTKAIEFDPKFVLAYYQRGEAKIELGQKESGSSDLTKASEIRSDWSGAIPKDGKAIENVFGPDIRKASWGDSPATVKANEKWKFFGAIDKGSMVYEGILNGLSCWLRYGFNDSGELYDVSYMFNNEHANENDYVQDFYRMRSLLTEKYGKAIVDTIKWNKDLYKDDPQKIGMAISVGHVKFTARWITEKTRIILMLNGDNYKVSLYLNYQSMALLESANEEDQKKSFKDI